MTYLTGRVPVVALVVIASACSRDPAETARKHIERGDRYLAADQLPAAIIEYRNAARALPDSADVQRKLADAAGRAGDVPVAANAWLTLANLVPGDVDAQVTAASIELLAGRGEAARDRALSALQVDDHAVGAYIVLGHALARLHDPSQSRQAFLEAVRAAPSSIDAHVALGSHYWADGRATEAERELRRAVDLGPSHVGANRALGLLLMATGRMAQAEPLWRSVAAAADGEPLALADYYVSARRLPDAVRELEARRTQPKVRDEATLRLVSVLYALGRRDDAYSTLEPVLITKHASPALLLRSRLLLADGRLDEALDAVHRANSAAPTSESATVEGAILAEKRDEPAAERAFRSALGLNPANGAAALGIARVRLRQRRPADAVEWAERAATLLPGDFSARATLVLALAQSDQLSRAARVADDTARAWPDLALAHLQLGMTGSASGDAVSARRSFERALEIDPNLSDAVAGLVALDLRERRPLDARARADRHLRGSSDAPSMLILTARAHMATGDSRGAEALLRRAIDRNPESLDAYGLLGRLYLTTQRLDDALEQFQHVADRTTTPSGGTMVGMILEQQGRTEDAMRQYERTLADYPHAAVAANNLAWLYAERDRFDEALRLATAAKADLPRSPEVNDTLGWVYYRKGQPGDAIRPFADSVEARPDRPLYHYHLGLAYRGAGQLAKARETLMAAIALPADFPDRDRAVAVVKAIDSETRSATR